jgi:hypothetical protein
VWLRVEVLFVTWDTDLVAGLSDSTEAQKSCIAHVREEGAWDMIEDKDDS